MYEHLTYRDRFLLLLFLYAKKYFPVRKSTKEKRLIQYSIDQIRDKRMVVPIPRSHRNLFEEHSHSIPVALVVSKRRRDLHSLVNSFEEVGLTVSDLEITLREMGISPFEIEVIIEKCRNTTPSIIEKVEIVQYILPKGPREEFLEDIYNIYYERLKPYSSRGANVAVALRTLSAIWAVFRTRISEFSGKKHDN